MCIGFQHFLCLVFASLLHGHSLRVCLVVFSIFRSFPSHHAKRNFVGLCIHVKDCAQCFSLCWFTLFVACGFLLFKILKRCFACTDVLIVEENVQPDVQFSLELPVATVPEIRHLHLIDLAGAE